MESIEQRLKRNRIEEDDLEESFVLGSGKGGQKINKTSSCVHLKHLPTGKEVSCQETRSRERNREIARQRLCEMFERERHEEKREKARQLARRRYQNRKPSKAEKKRRLEAKKRRSEKKEYRRKVRE